MSNLLLASIGIIVCLFVCFFHPVNLVNQTDYFEILNQIVFLDKPYLKVMIILYVAEFILFYFAKNVSVVKRHCNVLYL